MSSAQRKQLEWTLRDKSRDGFTVTPQTARHYSTIFSGHRSDGLYGLLDNRDNTDRFMWYYCIGTSKDGSYFVRVIIGATSHPNAHGPFTWKEYVDHADIYIIARTTTLEEAKQEAENHNAQHTRAYETEFQIPYRDELYDLTDVEILNLESWS